jgi:hypothetical protein
MSDKIPIDRATLSELFSRPIIVRIVTILDITRAFNTRAS